MIDPRALSMALRSKGDAPPVACCTRCDAPLIGTMAFPGREFICVECGRTLDFVSPRAVRPSPALDARYAALKAEWTQHAGAKLVGRWWVTGCTRCSAHREYHDAHASPEELEADRRARQWIRVRTQRFALTPRRYEVLMFLHEHPWSDRAQVAEALGSTIRGIGNVLARLLDADLVTLREIAPERPLLERADAGSYEWAVDGEWR